MRSKRAASRAASQEDTADDSSSEEEQFLIQSRPRHAIRKTRASSSRATEEATNMVEGQVVCEAGEARASDIIQKVKHPLQADYEYTLRRVDRRYPRRPTNFTRRENHSMINQHKNPYDWTTELRGHRFWNHFQADWYLKVIKDRKNPITS
jgi:hypothetical protein